ncbi:hypothetical protein N656DRAFT_778027 [Canariomyces notabilis]|uniref:Uncharacterized protein n=1 Tax=Canariomyces notabilis TaxID=2074819 RepID=A0AAN6TGE5_9PEZI|nr:hypothetical protein N656DRAFT_778027 [Canariomyces arenarius]
MPGDNGHLFFTCFSFPVLTLSRCFRFRFRFHFLFLPSILRRAKHEVYLRISGLHWAQGTNTTPGEVASGARIRKIPQKSGFCGLV